jgi:alpha 1,3-glucosidase
MLNYVIILINLETKRREPWLFSEETTLLIREAIVRRYTLLPYYYTLFHESEKNGSPVMRPLFFEYPQDTSTYSVQSEFLIGKDLLIKPVINEQTMQLSVYLPGDDYW